MVGGRLPDGLEASPSAREGDGPHRWGRQGLRVEIEAREGAIVTPTAEVTDAQIKLLLDHYMGGKVDHDWIQGIYVNGEHGPSICCRCKVHMKQSPIAPCPAWDPRTSIADAWLLVDALTAKGIVASIDIYVDRTGVALIKMGSNLVAKYEEANTPELAITLAALAALEALPKEGK